MTCFRMPDGTTLRQYCIINNIPYCNVYRRLDNGIELMSAIDGGKKAVGDTTFNRKVFYNGKAVCTMCKDKSQYRRIISKRYRGRDLGLILKQEGLI